jgi:predicted MPP superfamily phosphohydrolase
VTRRQFFLASAAAGGFAALDGRMIEPGWIDVTHKAVKLRLDLRGGSLRLLHLSDLHASAAVPIPLIENAIALGLAEKPDLVCLTGDYITIREEHPRAEYVRALRKLSAAVPTFAVLGNHDGGRWAAGDGGYPDHRVVDAILQESGIEVLHNRSREFSVRGQSITLVGVGDLWMQELHAVKAFAEVNSERNIVLLSHNPDSKAAVKGFPWDLMLSGHTHGGQVQLPLIGALYAPVRDRRYIEGLKPWGQRQIHVTRGVGSIDGVRFLCRPEVSLLTLV